MTETTSVENCEADISTTVREMCGSKPMSSFPERKTT